MKTTHFSLFQHTHRTSNTYKFLSFILLFLASNSLLAQNTTEWKTEGNTADSSAFIGTTNESCL